MNVFKWVAAALVGWVLAGLAVFSARAQEYVVVQNCGALPLATTVGSARGPVAIDANGNLCVASFVLTTVSTSFTRPNDTTAYAANDLVANSTTAGSVVPMSFSPVNQVSGQVVYLRRAAIRKTTTVLPASVFRLHLFTASPTVTNGDNGTFAATLSGVFCNIDVSMSETAGRYSNGTWGVGVANNGTACMVPASGQTIYGLLETIGTYAPGALEVFTVTLEVEMP